jgi:ParB/RepB/Spo0J family partition protein
MTSLAMTNDGVSSNRFHSPAGGDLLRPSGDPGAPVRLRANLRRRAFVRACAHRNTLLESAAFGLHSSPSARRAVLEPGRCPGGIDKEQQHMTIVKTPTSSSVTRVELDPRSLLVDVNIRTDAQLDKAFIASIKDLGVLVPITAVRTAAGEVRVRFGHRRTLAAIEAELATVPVEIVGDEATDDAAQIERILTQHAENAHRAALTSSEQLGVVEQLSAFGMSAAQIAKRTKIKRGSVDASLAVASSELAKAATDRYDFLTLEQAAAVAEFDNDPDAVTELVVAAQHGRGFDHSSSGSGKIAPTRCSSTPRWPSF